MKGYFNKPEETANALRDGWFHTGDIAIMDEDGYIKIVDRVKDMVNVSGLKVYTRELDEIICSHPVLAYAAEVGIEDPSRTYTEIVACAIMLEPGIEKGEREKEVILSYIKERASSYKVPKKVVFLDSLPLSPIGKVMNNEIKQILKYA